MGNPGFSPNRRHVLQGGLALGMLALFERGAFAEQLSATPAMTEGPFYPDKIPLDKDNDLIIVGDHTTPAVGEITHLTGRILDVDGKPLKNAQIEIWQCDANAVYLNTRDSGPKAKQQDKNFQGYGRFETAADGGYRFRTIKPVPYPGRPAPHIHYKVSRNGRELLTSQIFIAGFAGNKNDGVYRSVSDPLDRELIQTDFKPMPGSKIGELTASFDVIVGRTPADADDHSH